MIELSSIEIAYIFVIAIQLVFWIVWLIGIKKMKETSQVPSEHGVSVLIAANNELENLKQLLPQLFEQTYNLFEIIVVDDRSFDGSFEYLLELSQENSTLKVLTISDLPDHLNGKKYAITLGVKAAKYDQILLTDADCLLNSKNWIASFANAWHPKISFVLAFSGYESKPGLLNYFIRFETLLTGIQYIASAALGKPYMGVGRNLSYSKKLFLDNKGFHGFQNLMGGDDDLFVNKYAIGSNTATLLSSESITTSIPKTTIKDYSLQKTRHLAAGKHYSMKSKITLSGFTFSWMLIWALLPFIILSSQNTILIGVLLFIRYLFIGNVFYIFSKKSFVKFKLLGLMLLDFMFALYYFATGTKALLAKSVRWK